MARAHRLAAIIAICTAVYLLLFFAVLPTPFVDERVAAEVLPTVRVVVIRR
jgi:hypothetical protein